MKFIKKNCNKIISLASNFVEYYFYYDCNKHFTDQGFSQDQESGRPKSAIALGGLQIFFEK